MVFRFSKIVYMVIAFAFVAVRISANDAHSKSIATTGRAQVITPISLVNTDGQELDFGSIVIGTTDSRVVVSPSAAVSPSVTSGNAVVLTSAPQTAAKFTVSGEVGKTYVLTVPASTTITNGVDVLDIQNISCSNGTGGTIGTNDVFYIGGELLVPATSVPGYYQGTFNVTVAYN